MGGFKIKHLILFGFLALNSCSLLKDRTVDKSNQKIRLVESAKITEKAPGDNVTVYLPYPLPSPERPKNQVKRYKGDRGATVDVGFDSTGVVNRIDADCPEIDRVEEKRSELDYQLRTKEVESKANIELAKQAKYTIWGVAFLFALAYVVKSKIKTG